MEPVPLLGQFFVVLPKVEEVLHQGSDSLGAGVSISSGSVGDGVTLWADFSASTSGFAALSSQLIQGCFY